MKKFLALFLIVATALTSLAGCSESAESSDLNIYSEASYDNESRFVPEEESKEDSDTESTATNEENSRAESGESGENDVPLSGEFVVKDKKYTFEGNDLVIVNVENQTNKNYSVTITGTYLDKDGNVLQTETQTFDQYSAGYSGYFLFKPDLQFDKFTYEFKSEESEGPFYAKSLVVGFDGIRERGYPIMEEADKGDFTQYPSILSYFYQRNTGDQQIYAHIIWLLVNEKNEIISYESRRPRIKPGEELYNSTILLQTKEEKIEWPESWKGTILAIPIIVKVSPDEFFVE